jgi:hypothetical protein
MAEILNGFDVDERMHDPTARKRCGNSAGAGFASFAGANHQRRIGARVVNRLARRVADGVAGESTKALTASDTVRASRKRHNGARRLRHGAARAVILFGRRIRAAEIGRKRNGWFGMSGEPDRTFIVDRRPAPVDPKATFAMWRKEFWLPRCRACDLFSLYDCLA